MLAQELAPRITVRMVIAATADVTGTPVRDIVGNTRREPERTYRGCAYAVAFKITGSLRQVCRGFERGHPSFRRAGLERLAADNEALVARIMERASELALEPSAAPVTSREAHPCIRAVLVAASEVTGSSVRDIVRPGRLQPWESYRQCVIAAAYRLNINRFAIAAALACAPHTITGRPGRRERIEQEHGTLVARIVERAKELARLPVRELDARYRGPAVSVPPSDPREALALKRATIAKAAAEHSYRISGGRYGQPRR